MRSQHGLSPAGWVIGGSLVALACSLTAPSKDELFRAGRGGNDGDSGSSGSGSGGVPAGSGASSGRAGGSVIGGGGSDEAAAGSAGDNAGSGSGGTDSGVGGVPGDGGTPGSGEAGATEPGSAGAGGEGGGGAIDYGPFDPTEGLVARYAFDETEGTVVSDSIGSRDGTVNGTATWVTGKIGGALRLSGTSAYADIPVTVLATLEEVTLSIWFNPATGTMWSRVLDIGSSQQHWMYFTPIAAPTGQATGTHVALDVSNQITAELHASSFVPPVQTWSHITITWSREYFAYYINGKLAASDDSPLFTPSEFVSYTPSAETLRTWLGRSSFSVDPYFTGALDDFRIYDRALPPPHVAALYELEE